MTKLKSLLLAMAACSATTAALAEPKVYTIESSHTYPSFEVSHRGLSFWRGKLNKTTGKVWLDREKQTGKVEITVDTSTANFGLAVMDQRAKNEDWFYVEKYPTATYKSDSITFKNGAPAEINGQLTLRGITKPVKLQIVHFKCEMNAMFKREVCGADAKAELDRRDFGMTHDIVNNDGSVRLQIAIEALEGDTLPNFTPPPGGFPDGGPGAGGPPPGAPPAGAPPR